MKTESSKGAMAIMAVGGVAVAGLVVWALTRTVQPVPTASTTVPMGAEQQAVSTSSPTPTMPNPAFPAPPSTASSATPAQTSTYTPNPPSADENATVTRIALADLKAKVDSKQVTVIDVRQDTAYMTAHIPGSMNIPMALVESRIADLPKNKPIVTYCT